MTKQESRMRGRKNGKPESEIELALVEKVESVGGLCPKFISPDMPGVMDRIVMLPDGKIIFAETKAEFGLLSGIQKFRREQFLALNMDVRVVKGKDALKEIIKEIDKNYKPIEKEAIN